MSYWPWKIFISWIPGQEWDENWRSWPHCNGQAGCWMHCTRPPAPYCICRCFWCKIAKKV